MKKLLETICGVLAGLALFGIMALTFFDVGGRKLLSHSITGSLELTELLMVVVIFAALPLVSLRGEHVVFDSLDPYLPSAVRLVQRMLVQLLCGIALLGLGVLMWQTGGNFLESGETTAQLKILKAPFIYGMSLLCAVTGTGAPGVHDPARARHGRKRSGHAMTEALIGFVAIFALALLRVPLAFGMGLVGIVGIGLTRGWGPALASTAQVVQETGFAYTLSVIPLFILMGNFVARAGLAHELFHAAYVFIGHLRGGLAHATIAACAGFGAICGSSIATAATMSKVAYPSMKKLGYSDSLSTGVIAAGGTLGIMIPPSTIMVIYGIVTETNIGKLFAAGVIPGLLTAILLMVAVVIMTSRDPEHAPAGEKFSWAERWKALRGIWGVLLLVIVVLGGIYGGFFTATEGAGIGASGAFLFAVARRALTVRSTLDVLIESARTTAMLFTLLIAATIFANFVNFTSMPGDLKDWITHLGLSPVMIVGAMMVIYVLLGTVMEELTMVLLTIPLFFPIVVALGFDPVWFGVLIVMVIQIGLISPPVGMNLFVINTLLPRVGLGNIFRGVWPFVVVQIITLGILLAFPFLSLWLPSFMN